MTENTLNTAEDIRSGINEIAQSFGVDLTLYGDASPTKLFTESLIRSVDIIKSVSAISLTEQNPYTAVTLKSMLGLAAMSQHNVTRYMQASKGKVTLHPVDKPLTLTNRSQLQTDDGVFYYIHMPHDTVMITEPTEFDAYQGVVKTMSFTATGERHESFLLKDEELVDPQSVSVIVNNKQCSIGLSIFDDTDFFITLDSHGECIIVPAKYVLATGVVVKIHYASCYGYIGDKPVVGTRMLSPALSSLNPDNKDFTIEISIPIIGGTAKPILSDDLAVMLTGASVTNLIGNAQQLETYLKLYKGYVMSVSERRNYILTVSVCRSLRALTLSQDYWTAVAKVQIDTARPQDAAEFESLRLQLERLPDTQLSNIIQFVPALIQYAAVVLDVNMTVKNVDLIKNTVSEYALKYLDNKLYENADLYAMINGLETVTECQSRLLSGLSNAYVNQYGNVFPQSPKHIVIINKLYLTVNGESIVIANPANNSFNYSLDILSLI
jgi:hypothetical protein